MKTSKLKILFLIPTLDGGGAEKVLVDLVNNLNKTKYDISVKTLLSGGVFESHLNENIKYSSFIMQKNSLVRKILFYLLFFILPSHLVYKLIVGKKKYDIEVSYLEGVTTKIISSSSNLLSRKIAFVHIDFNNNYSLFKVYKNYEECLDSYKLYYKVVFVSKQAENGFHKKIGVLQNAMVVHNVLDNRIVLRKSIEKLSISRAKQFVFISVGRLCAQKGYDRLLQVVDRLNKDKFDFELWIVGDGPHKRELEIFIENNRIDNVKLLGFHKNPYKYIAEADMFVCSSRAEGYSTVVTEALILKKPVLTTDCAGMSEVLENGKFGIIVENSEDGIYKGMRNVLNNASVYQKYAMLAKERSSFFDVTKNILIYEKLFDD